MAVVASATGGRVGVSSRMQWGDCVMDRRLISDSVFVLVLALLLSGCAGVRLPVPSSGGRPDAVVVSGETQQSHFDQVTVEVPGNVRAGLRADPERVGWW